MADTYEIKYLDETVGHVRTQKQGLYLCFHCRCSLPDQGMYRIHAVGSGREDLGICVPMDGSFGIDKKIPLKRLGEAELSFQLVPKDWKPQEPVLEPEMGQQKREEEKTAGLAIEEEPIAERESTVVDEPMAVQESTVEEEPVAEQENAVEEEQAHDQNGEACFIPVSEDGPFAYLDKLEDACMDIRDDQPGIVIQE